MSGYRTARGSQPPAAEDWLENAVRAWYPKLARALGSMFDAMLATYLRETGPLATMRDRGTGFADFLARTPELPLWYAELARLDLAHVQVLHAPSAARMSRAGLSLDRELRLIPAHALVSVTTSVDEVWQSLDRRGTPPRAKALDWPRTVLVWRAQGGVIADRTVWPDEGAALSLAAGGTDLAQLARMLSGDNPHARALDLVLRWLDDGVIAA
jgi:hypothetical protein